MKNNSFQVLLQPSAERQPAGLSPAGERAISAAVIYYQPEQTVAQAIYLSGLFEPPALCAGLGKCGKCKVRYLDCPPEPSSKDALILPHDELKLGWRLGCSHYPAPGLRILLPSFARLSPCREKEFPAPAQNRAPLGTLAVDLGTTSIAWQWIDPSGSLLREGSIQNPQLGAGSEIVSRLQYARSPAGASTLQNLVVRAIENIEQQTIYSPPPPGSSPSEIPPAKGSVPVCIAGNPTMTALLLGEDVSGLFAAPYRLPVKGGETIRLPGLGLVWLPPQLAPFVGGDISAGYAAVTAGPRPPAFPFLLADMGTNGEFLLALSENSAVCASVALGPALEGAGLTFGTVAKPGAITGFSFTPQGPEPVYYDGKGKPEESPGITGTGYLSLIRHLLRQRVINREGRLSIPAGKERFCSVNGPGLALPHGFALFARDIEEILKVKSAFAYAVQRLLETGGMETKDLKTLYLAGSLGQHLSPGVLEDLGFVPQGFERKIELAGNTSLAGAALLTQDAPARARLTQWAGGAVVHLDLATDKGFMNAFIKGMRFNYIHA